MAKANFVGFKNRLVKQLAVKATIDKAKADFKKEISKKIKDEIIGLIEIGVTPVRMQPKKFQKYSESYKQAIRGKLSFRNINGKTVPLKGKDKNLENKNVSPVNMKVTGKMLRSLRTRITTNGVFVWFSSEIAKYHNETGVGPNNVKRRLLPNQSGERFTPQIERFIVQLVEKLIRKHSR